MTDTTTPATPPKKMWTRCNGCQQRIYNEPLDIKIHAPICPQNMLLTIQKLTIAVLGDPNKPRDPNSLLARTAVLEETVGTLDEHITAEPTLDPDGVDLDAYTSVVGTDETQEPSSEAYEDAVAAFTTVPAAQVLDPVTGLYVDSPL